MDRNPSVRFSTSKPVEHRVTSISPSNDNLKAILALPKPSGYDEKSFDKMDSLTLASLDFYNPKAADRADVSKGLSDQFNQKGWTALMYATYLDHMASVQVLVNAGARVNQQNAFGQTALILAASCSANKMVEYLISKGADIHVIDKDGRSALHYASLYGQESVVNCLLSRGADPNKADLKSGSTPLHMACEGGKTSIIHEMLMHNGNPKLSTKRGYTGHDLVAHTESKQAMDIINKHVDLYESLSEGMDKYIPAFKQFGINWKIFLQMGNEDYEALGITLVGPKLKLQNIKKDYLARYNMPETKPDPNSPALAHLRMASHLSPPTNDTAQSSQNTAAHLRYIQRELSEVYERLNGFLGSQRSITEADLRTVINTIDEINSRVAQLL